MGPESRAVLRQTAIAAACALLGGCWLSHTLPDDASITLDAGPSLDATLVRDAGRPMDASVPHDAPAPPDSSLPRDADTLPDLETLPDTSVAPDLGSDASCTVDFDGDGHRAPACGGDDCDDTHASTYPGAPELCNGVDDDCDGIIDDGASGWCNGPGRPPHTATSVCTMGACVVVTCLSPYLDCTSAPGCETDPRTDPANCGTCGHDCAWACTPTGCDDAVQVSAGPDTTCARRASGSVDCWGSARHGALGDGTTTGHLTPIPVAGLTDAIDISSGGDFHSCAVRAAGTVVCWGANEHGEIGDGTTFDRSVPVPVTSLTNAIEVSVGDFQACALLTDGTVGCWGAGIDGQLGDGTESDAHTPVTVAGLTDAIDVSTGEDRGCGVRRNGSVVCWGNNSTDGGWLGSGGGPLIAATPIPVLHINDATSLAVGGLLSCVLRTGGAVSCWGKGALGDGTVVVESDGPIDVIDLPNATDIGTGYTFACARRTSGTIAFWGTLGSLPTVLAPTDVPGLTDAISVSAEYSHHICALRAPGSIVCWGANDSGQLGDGTTTFSATPVAVVRP